MSDHNYEKYGGRLLLIHPSIGELKEGIARIEEAIDYVDKEVGLDRGTIDFGVRTNEFGDVRLYWKARGGYKHEKQREDEA